MRRVLAIGLAIIIVMIASRGVVAQEDSVSDRLLEILKDRQIISNDEFGELKGLAAEMKDDRADLDRRLGDLDRSIADYLAEGGDATAAGVTYTVGQGFTFTTSDNLFSLTIGGQFNFTFSATDGERNPQLAVSQTEKRDRTNFGTDARFHFLGHAFTEDLTYYFEFLARSSTATFSEGPGMPPTYGRVASGVYLFEGYVDYNLCGWTNVRAGQFRAPFGRQALVHQSDLTMGNRAIDEPRIDIGIMFHNMYTDLLGFDGMAAEYMIGLFDGQMATGHSWVSPAMRLVLYPLGPVAYVEGDWEASGDPKFGIGASYLYDRDRLETGSAYSHRWGIDAVLTWSGLYLTGEWHRSKQDLTGQNAYSPSSVVRNWFIQAGFMVMPSELELFIRYSKKGTPKGGMSVLNRALAQGEVLVGTYDNMVTWAAGATYYFEGHPLKATLQIVSMKTEYNDAKYTYQQNVVDLDDDDVLAIIIGFQLEW